LIGDRRFRGEADMHDRVASTKWVADDPKADIEGICLGRGRLPIYHLYRTVPVPGRPHLMSGNISSLLSNVGEHDYC
jgi:hypothetical protein